MQAVHRGSATGPAVGGLELLVALRAVFRQETGKKDAGGSRAHRLLETPAERAEQIEIALRAQHRAQEFSTGAGIVPEPASVPVEPFVIPTSSGDRFHLSEETDRDVPVAHLADQLGEASQPPVERLDELLARPRQQSPPEAEAGAEMAEVSMQVVEDPRRRLRAHDDLVRAAGDLMDEAIELAAQSGQPRVRAGRQTIPSPSGPTSLELVERCGPDRASPVAAESV